MVGRGKDDHDVHGNSFLLFRIPNSEYHQGVHRGDVAYGPGFVENA